MSLDPNDKPPFDGENQSLQRYSYAQLITVCLLVLLAIMAFTYAVSKGWLNVREFNFIALLMPALAGIGIAAVNGKYLREYGSALLPIACIIAFLINFSGIYIMKSFQIRKTPDMEYWINVFLHNLPFALASIFLYFLYAWLSQTPKPILMLCICLWQLLCANLMFMGIISSPRIFFPMLFTGVTFFLSLMHWNELPKPKEEHQ